VSDAPTRVLFVSTGGAARAILAEALLRHVGRAAFEVASAGTDPRPVDPLALQVLGIAGIDATGLESRSLDAMRGQPFDYVITVCDNAAETCPLFPGPAKRIHWSFPDPAAVVGGEAERLASFRQVRDDIETQLKAWLARLAT